MYGGVFIRERPTRSWRTVIKSDLLFLDLSPSDAHDCDKWRTNFSHMPHGQCCPRPVCTSAHSDLTALTLDSIIINIHSLHTQTVTKKMHTLVICAVYSCHLKYIYGPIIQFILVAYYIIGTCYSESSST